MESNISRRDEFEDLYDFKISIIKKFNTLINHSISDEIYDIKLEEFIDYLYKRKLSEICNIPVESINYEMLKKVEEPVFEKEKVDDNYVTYKRPLNTSEIREIAKRYNDLNTCKEENINVLDDERDITNETITSHQEEKLESKSRLSDIDKQISDMYDKYKREFNSGKNTLDRIELLKVSLYKKAISEICNIKREEINSSVISQMIIGVSYSDINDGKQKRRAYTDEEVKSIVPSLIEIYQKIYSDKKEESNAKFKM